MSGIYDRNKGKPPKQRNMIPFGKARPISILRYSNDESQSQSKKGEDLVIDINKISTCYYLEPISKIPKDKYLCIPDAEFIAIVGNPRVELYYHQNESCEPLMEFGESGDTNDLIVIPTLTCEPGEILIKGHVARTDGKKGSGSGVYIGLFDAAFSEKIDESTIEWIIMDGVYMINDGVLERHHKSIWSSPGI